MTRRSPFLISAALAVVLTGCSRAAAERGSDEPAVIASDQTVSFVAQPRISSTSEALPRLVGSSPAFEAINADLERFDAAARADVCGSPGSVERSIAQPMTGPGFISFLISQSIFCEGAAHPSIGQIGLTYDLSAGRRVDWAAVIPGLQLTVADFDGEGDGQVVLPALYQSSVLAAWYSAQMLARPDVDWVEQCRTVFDPGGLAERYFNIWAGAEGGGVVVVPDLPHAVMACGESAVMSQSEMQRFGTAPALIEAIAAARAAGNWAPKDPPSA